MKEIKENLNLIKSNLPKNFNEFLELGLVKDGMYKRMEFSIQNVLDICSILNSDLELGIPSDEGEVIDNLVKNKILSNKMGKKVKEMKGFRNFLVHRYGHIDDRIAFKNIRKGSKDFYDFIDEIDKFLKELKHFSKLEK